MRLPSFTRLAVLVAVSGLFGGCATAPADPPGLFGSTREVGEGIDLASARAMVAGLQPGETRTRLFEVVEGEDEGSRRRMEVSNESGTLRITTTLAGEDRPRSAERMRVGTGGDLVSERSVTRDRDVITEFDPPLLVFPARLEPGTPARGTNRFIVHPLSDPERVKQRGNATVEITLVGREAVSLPDAVVQALRVRTRLEVDFGAAEVERTTDQWLMPGAGLIAERYDETIRVLGVPTERRHGTMRAVRTPEP